MTITLLIASKKKRGSVGAFVNVFLMLMIGVTCGLLSGRLVDIAPNFFVYMAYILISVSVSVYLNIIVHEAGHLVFGLLTGYGFSSFRISSIMISRKSGKLCVRLMKVPGTAGQCLMTPPEKKNGKIPFMLYNLGGVLFNIFFALISAIVAFITSGNIWVSLLFSFMALVGFGLAVTNGIPMTTGLVDNDGKNMISLKNDENAIDALCAQLNISRAMTEGTRIKDMPLEWFSLPNNADMNNALIATIAVFKANYLIDDKDFCAAEELIDDLIDGDNAILGLHKSLLVCEKIFLMLILEGKASRERIEELMTKNQKSFIKQMHKNPSVLRFEYAVSLLLNNDRAAADKVLAEFEKVAKIYPYKSDIESEKELIAMIDEKYEAEKDKQ